MFQLLGRSVSEDDTVTISLVWDYLTLTNQLLDPILDTVMQKLPFLRFVPSKIRTLFVDVMTKRNQLLDMFYQQQKVWIFDMHPLQQMI